MTTCYLAPDPIQSTYFIPGGNTPANGGQVFFYAAGSSVKQTVYKDNAAATPWTNPIVLDSGGNLPNGGEVWFPTGQTFKAIFAPSNDTDPPASPYWTKDNLAGMNDVATQTGSEWNSGPTPTYVSGTQFTLSGDQTATFTVGRRLKSTNTAGTVYSVITSVSFGGGTTTVNVASDAGGALDAGLSAVFYGIFDPTNPSISPSEVQRKGANVASAANGTTNIWSVVGDYLHITGVNDIWHFSSAPFAGAAKDIVFDGALRLMSSSNFTIPGNQNVTTAAGDTARVRADSLSSYVFEFIQRAAAPMVGAQAANTFLASGTSAALPPSFRTLSGWDGGTWVLLDKQAAASSAAIVCSTGIGTFDEYAAVITNLVIATANSYPVLQLSSSQGASFDGGAASYKYAFRYTDSAASSGSMGSTDARIVLAEVGNGVHNAASTSGWNGTIYLHNTALSTKRKGVTWVGEYVAGNADVGETAVVEGAATGTSASTIANPVNAFRVSTNAGVINTGTISVYGLRST